MKFEVLRPVKDIEVMATGSGIRVLSHLRKAYGRGRWRKLKGIATVRLPNGTLRKVELHWYEAMGSAKET